MSKLDRQEPVSTVSQLIEQNFTDLALRPVIENQPLEFELALVDGEYNNYEASAIVAKNVGQSDDIEDKYYIEYELFNMNVDIHVEDPILVGHQKVGCLCASNLADQLVEFLLANLPEFKPDLQLARCNILKA